MQEAFSETHTDVTIMQPGYLPWLGYFDLVAVADTFVFYDDVHFDKGGWRNRNRILGPQGSANWLTAPVITAGRLSQPIRETALTPDAWQKKHLRTIQQFYSKAPHFDWCFPAIERYLSGKQYRWLIDLCLDGHRVFAKLLNIETPVRLSSELGFAGIGRTERLVAICRSQNATRYIAADASRAYMNEALWQEVGILLTYHNYPHPIYLQRDNRFVSHLSVVDALMFVGPNTKTFIGISHSKNKSCPSSD